MSDETPDPTAAPHPGAATSSGPVDRDTRGQASGDSLDRPAQPPGEPHDAALRVAIAEVGQRLDHLEQEMRDAASTVDRTLKIATELTTRTEAMDKSIKRLISENLQLNDTLSALRKYVKTFHPPPRAHCPDCGRFKHPGKCGGIADLG